MYWYEVHCNVMYYYCNALQYSAVQCITLLKEGSHWIVSWLKKQPVEASDWLKPSNKQWGIVVNCPTVILVLLDYDDY
jgi:hypothetical protein